MNLLHLTKQYTFAGKNQLLPGYSIISCLKLQPFPIDFS